jgi:hypothetical protein
MSPLDTVASAPPTDADLKGAHQRIVLTREPSSAAARAFVANGIGRHPAASQARTHRPR